MNWSDYRYRTVSLLRVGSCLVQQLGACVQVRPDHEVLCTSQGYKLLLAGRLSRIGVLRNTLSSCGQPLTTNAGPGAVAHTRSTDRALACRFRCHPRPLASTTSRCRPRSLALPRLGCRAARQRRQEAWPCSTAQHHMASVESLAHHPVWYKDVTNESARLPKGRTEASLAAEAAPKRRSLVSTPA